MDVIILEERSRLRTRIIWSGILACLGAWPFINALFFAQTVGGRLMGVHVGTSLLAFAGFVLLIERLNQLGRWVANLRRLVKLLIALAGLGTVLAAMAILGTGMLRAEELPQSTSGLWMLSGGVLTLMTGVLMIFVATWRQD